MILAKGKGAYIRARSDGPEMPSASDAVSTDSSVSESDPEELDVSVRITGSGSTLSHPFGRLKNLKHLEQRLYALGSS